MKTHDWHLTRERIRATAETHIYLFGDNIRQVGRKGQARVCRGEPNCFGIPTKIFPAMRMDAFMSDLDFDRNIAAMKAAIDHALANARGRKIVILPHIGEGLAELPKRAPRTYAVLTGMLRALEHITTVPFGDGLDGPRR